MTSETKNIYEYLIQDMIIDGINGMTPGIKELIQNAPVEQRRSMILTILEENNVEHRLICDRIQKTIGTGNYSEMEHIKDVVGMIREYVKVSAVEVKTHGEVMTPISLVEEMLDTLPYEVWSNPNLKWLEPANGIGTFVSVIIQRLMKGLVSYQPDEKLRYKHIMEEMIYVCELQAKNMFLFMYVFDPKDEYALNIYNGSYLDKGFNKHMEMLGVDKFDVIVMNPPYNSGSNIQHQAGTLWDKFVIKTISELIGGGYLVAVHPDGWRKFEGKQKNVQILLREKQLIYLEVHNTKDGIKTFGVSTAYDFYCLHNVPNTMFTKIKCMDDTIQRVDLTKMEFIPNGMYKEFENLIAKNGEEKVNMSLERYSYGTQKEYTSKENLDNFVYPCVYLIYKNGSINFYYSTTNERGHFGIPKIIWSNGSATTPTIDVNGEYGLTEFAYAIIDDADKLPYIKKAMENTKFTKLMSFSDGMTGVGMHKYNRKVIALFRKDFWKEFI